MARAAVTFLVGASLVVAACDSPRQQLEEFPPISCSFEDPDGDTHQITVSVDGEPAEVSAGDLTFRAEYRSLDEGRVLEIATAQSPGGTLEQVSYLVAGRTTLRNQFGTDGDALTGAHRIETGAGDVLWSCGVLRGD